MKVYISNKTAFKEPLRLILKNSGHDIDEQENWDSAEFIWKNVVRGLEPDKLPNLQILNIFMTSHQTLTEKSSLLRTGLTIMRDFFELTPQTCLSTQPLPKDDLLYISKPTGSFCGNGIRIHRGPIARSEFKGLHVVQHYIDKPLLFRGHKFDVRMFVLLELDRMMYYTDGSIKYSTNLYTLPNLNQGQTLQQDDIKTTHLTNVMQGNQSETLDKLKEVGIDLSVLYDFIKQLKPLFQHAQQIEKHYRRNHNVMFESFELLGLDIIFDENKRPWLLEINKDPSVKPGGILDNLMNNLLTDTLNESIWFKLDPSIKKPTGFIEL